VDGATPNGIARGLIKLKRGELLSTESTARLLSLMAASETGKLRLHAGVPPGWGFAHKTGTGQDLGGRTAGYNDVSIMTAPDGTAYAVVVQIADTRRPIPERQIFMQRISSSVATYHGN
jgi:beta-lactamase class A